MTERIYEANYRSSDILLVDNQLAPGQTLRNEPPLTLYCGNGCEDGAIHLTEAMATGLRDALNKWLEG